MIIHEKLRAMIEAAPALSIGRRFFPTEAPQVTPPLTLPYAVFMLHEEVLLTQNNALETTRPWKLYIYSFGASAIAAQQAAIQLKQFFCGYKFSSPGDVDTDIQAITIDTGLVDLERTPETKIFPCSLVLDVWEQLA